MTVSATTAAEIAFIAWKRQRLGDMEYPICRARAIVDKFVEGIERSARSEVHRRSHVMELIFNNWRPVGVALKIDEQIEQIRVCWNELSCSSQSRAEHDVLSSMVCHIL